MIVFGGFELLKSFEYCALNEASSHFGLRNSRVAFTHNIIALPLFSHVGIPVHIVIRIVFMACILPLTVFLGGSALPKKSITCKSHKLGIRLHVIFVHVVQVGGLPPPTPRLVFETD